MKLSSAPPRSANLLLQMLIASPELLAKDVPDVEDRLKKLAKLATEYYPTPAIGFDRWIYRLGVGSLGGVCLLSVAGAIYLATASEGNPPELLTALGSAAIGALAGLLVPSPASNVRRERPEDSSG